MKKVIFSALLLIAVISGSCSAGNPVDKTKNAKSDSKVLQLTNEVFKKLIFNYDVNKVWKYAGSKPIIIDFYADWCPPCHQLSPLVEEIAKEYEGKVIVYKVNTDQEKALAQTLGISSLPTLLYIPVNGKPHITIGILPKDEIVKNVNEILLTK
jgi:thioredoxin 1